MPTEHGYCTRSTGRIARKTHYCETRHTWAADHSIRAGDPYVEHIEFPGGESGYATSAGRPVRMAECAACAIACGRAHLLPPRPGYVLLSTAASMLGATEETVKAWQSRGRLGGDDREIPKDEVLAYARKRAKAAKWLNELLEEIRDT